VESIKQFGLSFRRAAAVEASAAVRRSFLSHKLACCSSYTTNFPLPRSTFRVIIFVYQSSEERREWKVGGVESIEQFGLSFRSAAAVEAPRRGCPQVVSLRQTPTKHTWTGCWV
jgi:hypothetical protein